MMPLEGYTGMFERMLDQPRIDLLLGTDFAAVRDRVSYAQLIYCGPIDEYFGFCFGRLPYRSLQFKHETLEQSQFQPVAVVNFPDQEVAYTRITEYKHLTGQTHPMTSISYEFPCAEGDPYYPIPRPENTELYKRYSALAESTANVTFLGRLGTYKYYNMDQVVGQALALYQRIEQQEKIDAPSPAC
jgi:UDP-galactopyranose mutase